MKVFYKIVTISGIAVFTFCLFSFEFITYRYADGHYYYNLYNKIGMVAGIILLSFGFLSHSKFAPEKTHRSFRDSKLGAILANKYFIVFGGILLVIILTYSFFPYISKILPASIKYSSQTEFWNIELNTNKKEIPFLKGYPTINEENYWRYRARYENYYEIIFKYDLVCGVIYNGNDKLRLLDRYFIGYTSQSLVDYLDEPEKIITSDNLTTKIFFYQNLNILFILEFNKVTALGIYEPKYVDTVSEQLKEKNLDNPSRGSNSSLPGWYDTIPNKY